MLLFLALAQAGMPAGIDLEAVDRWDGLAEQLLDGPPGCWEVVGRASWNWDIGRFGGNRGDAVFAGRLTDGEWSEVHLAPLGEIQRERRKTEIRVYAEEARFAPLMGRIDGARITVASDAEEVEVEAEEQAQASNVVRRTLDRIGGSAITSWAQWNDQAGGVVLHRMIPLGDGARADEAHVEVFFPGGQERPTSIDIDFPETFGSGSWPRRFKIRGAEAHLRGVVAGDHVFPASEAFRFDFGILGWWGSGAQTIVYEQIKPCPMPGATKPAPEADE